MRIESLTPQQCEKIVERFITACRTGDRVLQTVGPRRWDALGRGGLCLLLHNGLWPEALRRVLTIEVQEDVRWHIADTLSCAETFFYRIYAADDDLFFAGMRKLLPQPRIEQPITLWRGQRRDDPIGFCWTSAREFAVKFALHGTRNVPYPDAWRRPPAIPDGVVLEAEVPPRCIVGHRFGHNTEGELFVDPRELRIVVIEVEDERRPK